MSRRSEMTRLIDRLEMYVRKGLGESSPYLQQIKERRARTIMAAEGSPAFTAKINERREEFCDLLDLILEDVDLDESETEVVSEVAEGDAQPNGRPILFLSHSGAQPLVAQVTRLLGEAIPECEIWEDSRISGGRWDPQIVARLAASKLLLTVATPSVLSSPYVGFEIGYADRLLGASRIFVLRAGVKQDDLMRRPPFGNYQAYELSALAEMVDCINKVRNELGLISGGYSPQILEKRIEGLRADIDRELVGFVAKPVQEAPAMHSIELKTIAEGTEALLEAEADLARLDRYIGKTQGYVVNGDLVRAYNYYRTARDILRRSEQRGFSDEKQKARFAKLVQAMNLLTQQLSNITVN
jgi:hypothetical protein